MSLRSTSLRTLFLLVFLVPLLILIVPAQAQPAPGGVAQDPEREASSGLLFIENKGQFDKAAQFQVTGLGQTMWLSEDGIWLTRVTIDPETAADWRSGEMQRTLARTDNAPAIAGHAVRIRLADATFTTAQPFGRQDVRLNYYLGSDPALWASDVPAWQGVRYDAIYPGIDLELSGAAGALQTQLTCDGRCDGFAELNLIVDGADTMTTAGHSLRMETAAGSFTFALPQLVGVDGVPVEQPLRWRINGTALTDLPRHEAPLQLAGTTAPTFSGTTAEIMYGTFLGGGSTDFVESIAVDRDGRATLFGDTLSADFPTTPGAFDGTFNGGGFPSGDIVVAQLDPTGSDLVYATFIGGRDSDLGFGGAIDGSGNTFVTGWTASRDFPTTNGAYDVTLNGDEDAYVVKLNAFGGLTYGTYLGGSAALADPDDDELEWQPSGFDGGTELAVSSSGIVTIVGTTQSPDFPVTPGAFDTDNRDYCSNIRFVYPCADGFVARLNPTGSELLFASYLGGARDDYARTLAVDSSGRTFIAGDTFSTDFPVTPDALDSDGGGFDRDAFIVRVASNGLALQYASYLGGEEAGDGWYEGDKATDLVLDSSGYVYVTGQTWSDDFPTTAGAFDTVRGVGECPSEPNGDLARCPDAYVLRLRPDGRALDFSTLLGGSAAETAFSGLEGATGLTLDSLGNVVVGGFTEAPGFPTTPGAYSREHNRSIDSFVARFNPTGTVLQYSTFLNSNPGNNPVSLVASADNDLFVAAQTRSPFAPVTAGAYNVTLSGGGDLLALRLKIGPTPAHAGWLEVGSRSGSGGGISDSSGESSRPAMLASPTAGLVVAWSDGRGSSSQIFVRRWNGSAWVEMGPGSASGGGVSNTNGNSDFPALSADAAGSPVLAWHDNADGDNEIYIRRWNGSAWTEMGSGSAARGGISDNRGESSHPALALVGGDLFVVWDDDSKGNLEIYGLAWDGSQWNDMGGSATGGGISRNDGDSILPSVAALDGRPVVAWGDLSGGDSEIYARRYNGKRWTNAGKGSAEDGGISDNDGVSRGVDLVAGPNSVYAAWGDDSGGDLEIYVLEFDGKAWSEVGRGSARGGGISVNSGNSQAPALALGAGNRPIVTWYDGSTGDTEIFGRQWTGVRWAEITNGTGRGGGVSDNDGGSSWPAATVTDSGIPYIAWADNSGGNFEIFVRRATTSTCYQLQLRHSGQGSDPTPSPDQSFGCQPGWYTPGSVIQLTAVPDSGWTVAGWAGTTNDGSVDPTNTVVMPAQNHQALVAYTTEAEGTCYRLTLAHLGDGASPTASPSKVPNCLSGSYPAGTPLTLTANPANGWVVAEWTGTNNDASSEPINTVSMPASDHTVTAIYAESNVACYLLRLTFSGQGEAPLTTPENSDGCAPGRFSPGEVVGLEARPASGWQVGGWTGTDNDSASTVSNQLTMPASISTAFVQYEPAAGGSHRLYFPAVGGRSGN